ncbi:hypothetical protein ElyMa_006977700 [Elysia marginata]|uniref:Uncharacterized protein n=1 Tax=Elysia marginata TaxID=1093978 RepID=A0AAV4JP31_9GAST|nr:hypothetical protein ElyMa_006977700 [Elysia marginata]
MIRSGTSIKDMVRDLSEYQQGKLNTQVKDSQPIQIANTWDVDLSLQTASILQTSRRLCQTRNCFLKKLRRPTMGDSPTVLRTSNLAICTPVWLKKQKHIRLTPK